MGYFVTNNLARRVDDISVLRGIPKTTVETVIKDYLKSLIKSAELGERVVIDGLTTITVYEDADTGELFPRCRVSNALKLRLMNLNKKE